MVARKFGGKKHIDIMRDFGRGFFPAMFRKRQFDRDRRDAAQKIQYYKTS